MLKETMIHTSGSRQPRFTAVIAGLFLLFVLLQFWGAAPALADYVGTAVNRIFLDPASAATVANGYQNGDEISFILETTPADTGSTVGMAAWTTVYIPPGVEVIGAELAAPNGDGTYSPIAAKDTAAASDDCGNRGCAFPLSGIMQNGQVNEVQQDTGIFYSLDPQTKLLAIPFNVETTGSSKSGNQNIYNEWDYNQILAFGVKTPTALSGNSGTGNTPLVQIGGSWVGTGSPVAGSGAYYTNDYDPDCSASTTFVDDLQCPGPWQRIKYANAKIGGSGPLVPATTGAVEPQTNTAVLATAGYDFSVSGPLPIGANAVRFVQGIRHLGDLETARITFRVTDAAAFMAAIDNRIFCLDATGGDTDKPGRGPQDNNWRYYEGNNHTCFEGSSTASLLKRAMFVNGQADNGNNLSPNDIIGYEITFQNTTGAPLYDIDLTDTPVTTNLTLVAPGTAGCAYSSYNGNQAGQPTFNNISGGTAAWNRLNSLAAGDAVTVYVCGQVDSGAATGEQVSNRAQTSFALVDEAAPEPVLSSTTLGVVTNQIAGTIYADNDSGGDLSAVDAGLSGVTVKLYNDNNGDGKLDSGDTVAGTVVTRPNGSYEFNSYPVGNYLVVADDLPGYASTGDKDTTLTDCAASTANTCGVIGGITLTSDGASLGNDFFDAQMDYGDLTDSYLTLATSNGARHTVGLLYLGSTPPDADLTGQPGAAAAGDDTDGNNDDNGIQRAAATKWVPGASVNLDVTVTGNNGYLVGWFDWNGDGAFQAGEKVDLGSVAGGVNALSLTVPNDGSYTAGSDLNVRFRLYDAAAGAPTAPIASGLAINGEVEDYHWSFGPTAVTLQSVHVDTAVSTAWLWIGFLLVLALTVMTWLFIRVRMKR